MKYLFAIYLLACSVNSFSQDTSHKWKYFGLHQAAWTVGSSEEKFGVLTTNGVQKDNWHLGLATGFDWYGIRSIPVLASAIKSFGKSKHQPFVYGNAGINVPWMKSNNFIDGYFLSSSKYQSGFMGETGVGYFINLKNKSALSISAGYSYKVVGLKGTYNNVFIDPGDYYTPSFVNKYHYRRIALRIGIKI